LGVLTKKGRHKKPSEVEVRPTLKDSIKKRKKINKKWYYTQTSKVWSAFNVISPIVLPDTLAVLLLLPFTHVGAADVHCKKMKSNT